MKDKEKIHQILSSLWKNDDSVGKRCYNQALQDVQTAIDLQEGHVKIKKGCKYRCLSDMVNRDTGNISFIGDKIYLAPEDDTLVSEENEWLCNTSEDASNFELVEEPVSVWHGMSEEAENGRNIIIIDTKDFYGAVLRKGGSQLKNHNKERYVKWAYIDDIIKLSNVERTVKNGKEPASEDLETELDKYIKDHFTIDKEQLDRFGLEEKDYMYSMDKSDMLAMVRHFANWQKEQVMAKAVEREVKVDAGGYPYIDATELYDYDKDIPLAKEGDKYKVILIKED